MVRLLPGHYNTVTLDIISAIPPAAESTKIQAKSGQHYHEELCGIARLYHNLHGCHSLLGDFKRLLCQLLSSTLCNCWRYPKLLTQWVRIISIVMTQCCALSGYVDNENVLQFDGHQFPQSGHVWPMYIMVSIMFYL